MQEVATVEEKAGMNLSGDGEWAYDADSKFVREYGQFNPMEDFATSFASYFLADNDGSDRGLNAKKAVLDAMFDDLAQDAKLPLPNPSEIDPDANEVHAWWSTGNTVYGAWRGGW